MFGKREFYIVSPLSEDVYSGVKVSKDLKNIEPVEEISVDKLKKKEVWLVLDTPNFLYETVQFNFQAFVEELLRYRLRQHVSSLAFFETPFEIFYKIVDIEGQNYTISFFAIEKRNIEVYKSKLRVSGARVKGITHCIFSNFAFFKKFCSFQEELFLLVKPCLREIWFLLAGKERLDYVLSLQVDELLGISLEEFNSFLNKMKEYAYRTYQKDVEKFYILAKEFPYALEEIEKEFVRPEVNLPDGEKTLEFSQYLGALFVEPEFNFLSRKEIFFQNSMGIAEKLGILMCFFALLDFGIGSYLHWKVNQNLERLQNEVKNLQLYSQEVEQNLSPERIEFLKNVLAKEKEFLNSPRMERILLWCANRLPEGIRIEKMRIKKGPRPGSYTLEFQLSFPATSEMFNSFSDMLLNRFNEILQVQDRSVKFLQNKHQGNLYIRGIYRGGFS